MKFGMGLTAQQRGLFEYLKETCSAPEAIAPSFDQIMAHMCLHSKSGVHRLLVALEDKGYIRRIYKRARSIEILDAPALPCAHCGYPVGSRDCREAAMQAVA